MSPSAITFVLFVAFCKMLLDMGMERWQKALVLRQNILKTKDLHRLNSVNPKGGAVSGIWIPKTVRSEGNNVIY